MQEDLILTEHQALEIDRVLTAYQEHSRAQCVLLVSQDDGSLLAKQGHSKMFDLTALAALGAGVLSATHEMARQIGEPQFTVLFQEGVDQHIYLSRAGDRAILLTIFDDRSSIGLVRVWSQTAAERLAGLVTSSAALSQY